MPVPIATRASWGARFQDGDLTLAGLATEVFLHHTVTAHLGPGATVAAEQAQMRHLENIGQQRFGRGISYNLMIFPSGRAYQGVSWNRRGTHTGGRNSTSRSISFVGNFEHNHLTTVEVNVAAAILAYGRGRWWTHGAPLRAHRDVSATLCPGRHALARMGEIRAGGQPGQPDDLEEIDMWRHYLLARQTNSPAVWMGDGMHRRHIRSGEELSDVQYRIRRAGGNADVAVVARLDWLGVEVRDA